MKLTSIALAALLATGTVAHAGGMAEATMEPMVMPMEVVEEDSGSSGSFVIPLLLLAVIAAVAANSGGGDMMDSDG